MTFNFLSNITTEPIRIRLNASEQWFISCRLVLFQSETQIKAVFQMHARKDNSVFQDYLLLIKNGAKETSPDY